MKSAIASFLKLPATKAGIIAALMFQLIFSIVWMTGYRDISDNVTKLAIGIVNEDKGSGEEIVKQLQQNVPFQINVLGSLTEAKQQLNEREVQMILYIPANLTTQLQTPGQIAQLEYFINESNPAMIKSAMQSALSSITAAVNKQSIAAGAQAMLLQAKMPEEQAQQAAGGLAEKVNATVHFSNVVDSMANQMVPMMMVLASFVGAMVMQMNIQQASMMIGNKLSAWNKFSARGIINIASAVLIALVGSSMMLWLGGQSAHGFWAIFSFQALFLVTFMFVTQLFLQLFGMAGMMVNILLLSLQLVTSGAIVPKELLNDFYHGLSHYLPATYAVEGIMNVLFGGPSAAAAVLALSVICVAAVAIGAAVALAQKAKPQIA